MATYFEQFKKKKTIILVIFLCVALGTIFLRWSNSTEHIQTLRQVFKEFAISSNTSTSLPDAASNVLNNQQFGKQFEVTVVTAYFDIGTFQKGGGNLYFTKDTYLNWASAFKYLRNPLVVFTDSKDFKQTILLLRNETLPITRIVDIDKNDSWAFQYKNQIEQIFKSDGYPKHYPNTVIPEYACAQFAKYDVTARAASENSFRTKYTMWLDVGYFRNRKSKIPFRLTKPSAFNNTFIAMTQVYLNMAMDKKPEDIFKGNIVWVGGGLFFGTTDRVIQYAKQFKKAVEYFLSKSVINTDQQVIYSMFTTHGRIQLKPEIELQLYSSDSGGDWFYLGNIMVQENIN